MYLLTRWIKIIISTDLPSILYILFKDLNIYSRRVICSIHTDKFISPKCALQLLTSLNIYYYNMMEEIILYSWKNSCHVYAWHVFSKEKGNPILLEEERKCKRKKEKVFFGEAGIDQFFFCTWKWRCWLIVCSGISPLQGTAILSIHYRSKEWNLVRWWFYIGNCKISGSFTIMLRLTSFINERKLNRKVSPTV